MKSERNLDSNKTYIKNTLNDIFPEDIALVGPDRFEDILNGRDFVDSNYGANIYEQSLEIIDALVKVATFILTAYATKKTLENQSEINREARKKANQYDRLKELMEVQPEAVDEFIKRLESRIKEMHK